MEYPRYFAQRCPPCRTVLPVAHGLALYIQAAVVVEVCNNPHYGEERAADEDEGNLCRCHGMVVAASICSKLNVCLPNRRIDFYQRWKEPLRRLRIYRNRGLRICPPKSPKPLLHKRFMPWNLFLQKNMVETAGLEPVTSCV